MKLQKGIKLESCHKVIKEKTKERQNRRYAARHD